MTSPAQPEMVMPTSYTTTWDTTAVDVPCAL